MKRVLDKISEISMYVEELEEIAPATLEEYKSDLTKKAACERYVEKIMEAVTDLAFLAIKAKRLRMPEDDADAFSILLESKVIDEALSKRMKYAKGMKNIISHQYGRIDDETVFDAVREELGKDARQFVERVRRSLGGTS
ncbi:DUF86 domain-containing protein [Candidatus Woesearchaeota archaeon]|nr:DUF86 domain-containing protein [Candidatus Woesearchaeota archaeon]